jgi:hypothetical protein
MTDGFSNAGMVPIQFTAAYRQRFGVPPGRPLRT